MAEEDRDPQHRALKELFESKIAGLEKLLEIAELRGILNERDRRMEERFSAQQLALDRAADSLDTYKAQSNEWRGTLNDLTGKLIMREEYFTAHEALRVLVSGVDRRVQVLEGEKSGIAASLRSAGIAAAIAISLVSLMIQVWLRH